MRRCGTSKEGGGGRGRNDIDQELYQIWIDLPRENKMDPPEIFLLGENEFTIDDGDWEVGGERARCNRRSKNLSICVATQRKGKRCLFYL